ncbi:MAG: type II secretion system protein GspG [Gloeobacteraceae cyanobacterium ES-bin-144]|nr:type II secretion system protein GspG [Verrucomicrobiales bacterium]
MKTNSRAGRAAFTLIELMAVIAIIALLAGLVVGAMGFVKDRQAKETARVQIGLLSKAIEEYKLDMGSYPGTATDTPAAGDVSDEIYTALFYDGADKATKVYIPELDPRTTKQNWVKSTSSTTATTNLKITDPWGVSYKYRKGANAQNPDFDLWSSGKDGKSDINNPAMTVKDNKDDIRNF